MLSVNYGTKTYTALEEKIKIRRTGNVLGKQELCNNKHSSKNKFGFNLNIVFEYSKIDFQYFNN